MLLLAPNSWLNTTEKAAAGVCSPVDVPVESAGRSFFARQNDGQKSPAASANDAGPSKKKQALAALSKKLLRKVFRLV